MEENLHKFVAPSGDVYFFRRLKYRERKAVRSLSTKLSEIQDLGGKNPTVNATIDPYKLQEETAWRCIAKAPWLPEGKKCTLEMLDNIKPEDADVLDAELDKLNYPKKATVEKSDGQSGQNNQ